MFFIFFDSKHEEELNLCKRILNYSQVINVL